MNMMPSFPDNESILSIQTYLPKPKPFICFEKTWHEIHFPPEEPEHLDDLQWSPDSAEDEEALKNWQMRLKEPYRNGGFPKMVGCPNKPMGFPTKDYHFGV